MRPCLIDLQNARRTTIFQTRQQIDITPIKDIV